MKKKPEPADLSKVKTYPLSTRENLVKAADFAGKPQAGSDFKSWYSKLPQILAGKTLRQVVQAVVSARSKDRPVIFAMGAHVIKCGLNPVFTALMDRDVLTGIALNGAGIIHDIETAMIGETSENVAKGLTEGEFGFAAETGEFINGAAAAAASMKVVFGTLLGQKIEEAGLPFKEQSLLWNAWRNEVPVTVHIGIGTDIVHTHPSADGAAAGAASHYDFRVLTAMVKELNAGGVYFNIGSSVLLPEVFLKALTLARNLGNEVESFTTVNLDFKEHYRPLQNVVKRPAGKSGSQGYSLIGHHEILIPLIAQAVIEAVNTCPTERC